MPRQVQSSLRTQQVQQKLSQVLRQKGSREMDRIIYIYCKHFDMPGFWSSQDLLLLQICETSCSQVVVRSVELS